MEAHNESQVLCLKPKAIKLGWSHGLVNSALSLWHRLLVSLKRRRSERFIHSFVVDMRECTKQHTVLFYFILLLFHSAGWLNRIMSPAIIINQNYSLKNGRQRKRLTATSSEDGEPKRGGENRRKQKICICSVIGVTSYANLQE